MLGIRLRDLARTSGAALPPWRLACAALLFGLIASPAWAERRVALVFGAEIYQSLRPLANAADDARAVEETLDALGFEVELETDRDLRRMRRALEDFREDGAGADVALVFFAGHGVEIAGENRLLPVDADASSLERLKETSLPLEEVRAAVAATAPVGLILLDACRNDPFGADGGDGRSAAPLKPQLATTVKPGLGRVGRAENVLFSFSAAPGQTASDGAGDNSEFSAALAKFLPTAGLEIRSVLTLVQQEVYDFSRGRQLPYIESGLPRLFFAADGGGALPERDRLLLAMAEITPELRGEVETVAAGADMPLAPLYAALITSDGKALSPGERRAKLQEAAAAFVQLRADMRDLASADPRVAELRSQAEAKLVLGAFGEARVLLAQAADIDARSRETLKESFIERTLSEAATHYLAAGAAHAQLQYELAIQDYGRAAALYAEIEGFGLPEDARYQQVLSLELIGTLQTTLGNLPAARTAYEAMEAAARKRAESAPDNMQNQRDLVVARNKLAEVQLATGDLAGALSSFEGSREVLRGVIDKEPRFDFLRDLAVSYNRTGDVRRIGGQGQAALADHQAALKISAFLAEQVPDDAGFRRDLAVSHSKVGLALRLENDLAGAKQAYEASLSITEAMLADAPADPELRRDMTVSLNAVGDIRRLGGDNAGAFEPYRRSVALSRELVAQDPANTLYRRDLSVGLGKLADAKREAGDLAGALADYRSALTLAQHLAELDPSNAEWARDVSVSRNRVGDALLQQGDRAGAAEQYKAGFVIAQAQLEADPENVQRLVDAAYSRYKLASAGIDPAANLKAALGALTRLRDEGRLPGANQSWIAMVEAALRQVERP